jgi:hypothetical protein
MWIDPHFDMWNHFFHVRLPQGADVEAAVLVSVDIHINFENGINPYFNLPRPEFVRGWWKMWFFLRNDAAVTLPMFLGTYPNPSPTGGMRWPRRTSTSCSPCTWSFNSYDKRG